MNYTGAVPDTQRAADWRDTAACLGDDPERWFPKSDDGPWLIDIAEVKAICETCPSRQDCLQFAIDENISDGVYGGLTKTERNSLRRQVVRGRVAPEDVAGRAEEALRPPRERTLQTVFDDNTTALYSGHLTWTGPEKVNFQGRAYTPKRLAYVLDRGRLPDGPVRVDCGIAECVLPRHLTDQKERGACGTRLGYQRHRNNGEDACGPCKAANADADRRLRNTGTTKVLV